MSSSETRLGVPVLALAAAATTRTYDLCYAPSMTMKVSIAWPETDLGATLEEGIDLDCSGERSAARSRRRQAKLDEITGTAESLMPLPRLPQRLEIAGVHARMPIAVVLTSTSPPYTFVGRGVESCDTRAYTADTVLHVGQERVPLFSAALSGTEPADGETETQENVLTVCLKVPVAIDEDDPDDERDSRMALVAFEYRFTATLTTA